MPIEQTAGGVMITGESIMDYRLATMIIGLKHEIKGRRLTNKGRTCYAMLKTEYGLKGNKEKVLAQAQAIMDEITEGYKVRVNVSGDF